MTMSIKRGLYLISNDDEFELLYQKLTAALATRHVRLLQYRRKKVCTTVRYQEAQKIHQLCQDFAVPLIINDDVNLAQALNCGVHLGQGDGSILAARERLGRQAIIGRTCHGSLALARQAAAQGADYLAFGAVYPSATKPDAQVLDEALNLDIIRQAKVHFCQPICVIGGLTAENAAAAIGAGADWCAVISDILAQPLEHIATRIESWATLFD